MTVTATGEATESHPTGQIAISIETLAYLIIFLAALILRWIALGDAPLNEMEARQAIAAWNLLSPDAPSTGLIESPLTFAGAVISFGVASASNAAAPVT